MIAPVPVHCFSITLCHKKPIAHDFLSKETRVETQYVKFKVTQDTMATFSNNLVSICTDKSKRKAMNKNWYNQKANPALNTKAGNK